MYYVFSPGNWHSHKNVIFYALWQPPIGTCLELWISCVFKIQLLSKNYKTIFWTVRSQPASNQCLLKHKSNEMGKYCIPIQLLDVELLWRRIYQDWPKNTQNEELTGSGAEKRTKVAGRTGMTVSARSLKSSKKAGFKRWTFNCSIDHKRPLSSVPIAPEICESRLALRSHHEINWWIRR